MKPNLRRSRHGVALVIILAFIVLVAGLVVAYFSRSQTDRQNSNSSFNASKTDVLARSAADIIVSDLKQEIVNGSTLTTVGSAKIYVPTLPANMLPMRSGNPGTPPFTTANPDPIPNLIRRSIKSDSITAPGVASRASDLSSSPATATDIAKKGQITFARWNKHYLIPKAVATNDKTDPAAAFLPPDWVFVTSDSGPKAVVPSEFPKVVGRYAYAIYDEGGLLDMNVAGYPTGTTVMQSGTKSSLAYADLTALPYPIPNPSSATPPVYQVDKIVGWRNYATTQPNNSFPGSTFAASFQSSTSPANNFFNFVSSNTTGFLSIGTNVWNGRTDQSFLSRQQLIAFQGAAGFTVNSLQYLGTFSRDVNAPTFYYPTTAAATDDPIANSSNPNILTAANLRMASGNAAPDGFSWKIGDPVVGRRFPLKRLELIRYDATNTDTTSEISKYFGLRRASPSGPWLYAGSDGGTGTLTLIKTLDLVASAGREPNFFELLKAAIHKDSLGVGVNRGQFGGVGNSDEIDKLADLQILRIGANIIDQADSDSYPTVIAYDPLGFSPAKLLYAYGIEDLPYISALGIRTMADNYNNANMEDFGPATRGIENQIVPVLWNPHRTVNATTGIPGAIELYMTGRTRYLLRGSSGPNEYASDTTYYGASSAQGRFNEFARNGGFTAAVGIGGQNTGSVIISAGNFSSFSNPNVISAATGNGNSATGQFDVMRQNIYHTQKIFGLSFKNRVIAKGRPAIDANDFSGGKRWDGYFKVDDVYSDSAHHMLNPGVGSRGVNAVLRYMDHLGNWQVYSAFAANQAEPDGNLDAVYDRWGILDGQGSVDNSIFMWMFGTKRFPRKLSSVLGDNLDQQPGGKVSAAPEVANDNLSKIARIQDSKSRNEYFIMKPDPRTARCGFSPSYHGAGDSGDPMDIDITRSMRDPAFESGKGVRMKQNVWSQGSQQLVTVPGSEMYWPAMWAANQKQSSDDGTFYYDWNTAHNGRGKVRPGDDYLTAVSGLPNTSGTTGTNNMYQQTSARPVVMNRPFRSVGELGYVFRDMPFKSLDLFSKESVDAGLLDFFTVDAATSPLVAGVVNLNTRQKPVLQSILSGVLRQEEPSPSVTLASTTAGTLADDILTITRTTPLLNKAELVTKTALSTSNAFSGGTSSTYPSIKTQREAPIRALAGVANTRTWNLMIDVIAQTGRYPASATVAADLPKFVVEGERRYWVHVAIDRFTGKVVDQQWEPVYE